MYSFSAMALAYGLPQLQKLSGTKRMGVVVHSYAKRYYAKNNSNQYPAFKNAIDLLNHCYQLGAGGIQVGVNGWTDDFTGKVRTLRENLDMYLEGSIRLPKDESDLPRFEQQN